MGEARTMGIINFLKKLFHKKKNQDTVQQSRVQCVTQHIPQGCPRDTNISETHEIARQIVKEFKVQNIRQKNIERQRSVLGYGLRGKFRPRPAHEKKTFDLRKKPEKD